MAVSHGATALPKYAVIFRTHFWDVFAHRQFERLLAKVGTGDVYVLVDETQGEVTGIRHDRVVRMVEQDMIDMGLPRAGSDNMLWFNGDYPLYYFLRQHGGYDYYLQIEYDVVLNIGVEGLIQKACADNVDFVGLTKGEPVDEWLWLHTCEGVYATTEIQHKLICLSLYSRRALMQLWQRRLEMARQMAAGTLPAWPFCEGFIPTEIARAGYNSAELTDYADTDAYDFWPPYVESDLSAMQGSPVIHPVLDQKRYVSSLLKFRVGLAGYLNVNSLLHRKLRRLTVDAYVKVLATSFFGKVARNIRLRRLSVR